MLILCNASRHVEESHIVEQMLQSWNIILQKSYNEHQNGKRESKGENRAGS